MIEYLPRRLQKSDVRFINDVSDNRLNRYEGAIAMQNVGNANFDRIAARELPPNSWETGDPSGSDTDSVAVAKGVTLGIDA